MFWGFQGGTVVKNLPANIGDLGLIPKPEWFLGGGNGNPLQLFFPRKFHEQKSLVGYIPCGCKELDMTEWLSMHGRHALILVMGQVS